jgi:Ca2+-binding RTX toxin-like protein
MTDIINGTNGDDSFDNPGVIDQDYTLMGGDDYTHAKGGDDTVDGGAGNDTILGGTGDDLLNGNSGNDHLSGDTGNDTVRGGAGDDSIHGNAGDDKLNGGAGNDTIKGGLGDDTMIGGSGTDAMYGDEGNDTFLFKTVQETSTGLIADCEFIDGGADTDLLRIQVADATEAAALQAQADAYLAGDTSVIFSFTGIDLSIQNIEEIHIFF